jgi:hypothetical protein
MKKRALIVMKNPSVTIRNMKIGEQNIYPLPLPGPTEFPLSPLVGTIRTSVKSKRSLEIL